MLVLSRKVGESVMLADDIEVIVVAVDGQRVRLGIKAPKHISIRRAEMDPEVIEANKKAVISGSEKEKKSNLLKEAAKAKQKT